jgi:hypothetical protein
MHFNGQNDNIIGLKPISRSFADKEGLTYITLVITEKLQRPL